MKDKVIAAMAQEKQTEQVEETRKNVITLINDSSALNETSNK